MTVATQHVTVIDDGTAREFPAEPAGDALWVAPQELAGAGWERKPAGFCRGDLCVPATDAALVRADGAVDVAALARSRAQPVVHDDGGTVWVFDQPGTVHESVRASLTAPDFTLPDLAGREHSLRAERGRKVLLASWASW